MYKKSHPTWVRGLKLIGTRTVVLALVAPYVGAWIETLIIEKAVEITESHPTWVRGLKLDLHQVQTQCEGRTLRGCVD